MLIWLFIFDALTLRIRVLIGYLLFICLAANLLVPSFTICVFRGGRHVKVSRPTEHRL